MLVLLDLDKTVVHSAGSAGAGAVVVEHLDGTPLSAMTPGAVAAYRALAAVTTVVPVTTRTVAQYARVGLPVPARHAVCANGGVLLVDGARDATWDAWVVALLTGAAPLAEVEARLRREDGQPWVKLVRTAEDLFAYLVAHSRAQFPDGWLQDLAAELEPLGWTASVQGRKAYAVPAGLTKAAAGARLADLLGESVVSAAGDSLLDRPLLELALRRGGTAVRPAHGELHELGWTAPGLHVTAARGAAAGEELLRLLLERVPHAGMIAG